MTHLPSLITYISKVFFRSFVDKSVYNLCLFGQVSARFEHLETVKMCLNPDLLCASPQLYCAGLQRDPQITPTTHEKGSENFLNNAIAGVNASIFSANSTQHEQVHAQ